MAILEAQLDSMGTASVLQMLARARTSGMVTLTNGSERAQIAVESGRVVWARMNTGQRLGEALMARRLLSPGLLAQALEHQGAARRKQPLGLVLVGMGFLTPDVIAAVMEEQVQKVLDEVQHWNTGSCKVDEFEHTHPHLPTPQTCEVDALLLRAS